MPAPRVSSRDTPMLCMSRLRACVLTAIAWTLGLAAAVSAHAADASPWSGDERARVRLVAGSVQGEGSNRIVRAGIELRLALGWKTYWRSPGDAGVPPVFDFAGSENLKTLTMLWPAPERFTEAGISWVGYKGAVILPLHMVAQDPGRPIVLRVKIDYGICENVCVPLTASGELSLSGAASPQDGALAAEETRVPKRISVGEGGDLGIDAVRREKSGNHPAISVDVRASPGAKVDLFVEGPTSEWILSAPKPISVLPGGLRRFSFEVVDRPSRDTGSSLELRFTATANGEAIETVAHLD